MNRLVRVAVFVGALLLVMAVMALLGVRSGDRRALQKYRAELTAKGEKLTFAELTRGRQANAVDSHALITNATAKLGGGRFAPGRLEPRRYAQPGRASVVWRQASPTGMQSPGAGRSGTWEEFTAQMQASQDALQEIREALKDPAADAGPCTNMLLSRRRARPVPLLLQRRGFSLLAQGGQHGRERGNRAANDPGGNCAQALPTAAW